MRFLHDIAKKLIRVTPRHIICWDNKAIKNSIALTFDDGPDPVFTDKCLDILDSFGVSASFFVVGEKVKRYPDIVQRIIEAGHEIGNHGYSYDIVNRNHVIPYQVNPSGRYHINEIRQTNEILKTSFDYDVKLYRPPYGKLNIKSLLYCWHRGITTCLWSIDPKDFSENAPQNVVDCSTMTNIHDGQVILLHDNNPVTIEALPAIIEKYLKMGCDFKVFTDLL